MLINRLQLKLQLPWALALFFCCCSLLLLSACGGTAQPAAGSQPFQTTGKTTDNLVAFQFDVTPAHLGQNTFTVQLTDPGNKSAITDAHVQLFTTMLDMSMGTDSLDLTSNGKGQYQSSGELAMSGHWGIRLLVKTPDNKLHSANLKLMV